MAETRDVTVAIRFWNLMTDHIRAVMAEMERIYREWLPVIYAARRREAKRVHELYGRRRKRGKW